MEPFGRFLRRHEVVTPSQLEDALQLQVILGVRLGTALVECGALRPSELARQLAAHTQLPLAPARWLEKPSADALNALPRKLVREQRVLPMRLDGDILHVAVPDLDAAKAVADHTRHEVRPHVAPEVVLEHYLDRHLEVPPERRSLDLPPDDSAPPSTPPDRLESAARELRDRLKAVGMRPLEASEELVDEGDFSHIVHDIVARERPPGAEAEPAVRETDSDPVLALESRMREARDRHGVGHAAVQLASRHAAAAAFFVAHGDVLQGTQAAGAELEERIEGVLVPVTESSVFAFVCESKQAFRGTLGSVKVDRLLLRALGRPVGIPAAIFPVVLRNRVVNLLYVDNDGLPLSETGLGALQALCELVSVAYERIIRVRRRRLE